MNSLFAYDMSAQNEIDETVTLDALDILSLESDETIERENMLFQFRFANVDRLNDSH